MNSSRCIPTAAAPAHFVTAMSLAGQAAETERVIARPVRDAYDDLDKEISCLAEALSELHQKLDPVLTPTAPQAVENCKPGCVTEPARSELACGLRNFARSLSEIRFRVNEITHRVEM